MITTNPNMFKCPVHDNRHVLTDAVVDQLRFRDVSYVQNNRSNLIAAQPRAGDFRVAATCPGNDDDEEHDLVFTGTWSSS